jgi:hypothetical protein
MTFARAARDEPSLSGAINVTDIDNAFAIRTPIL